jgi:hypothetical protein
MEFRIAGNSGASDKPGTESHQNHGLRLAVESYQSRHGFLPARTGQRYQLLGSQALHAPYSFESYGAQHISIVQKTKHLALKNF